MLSTWWERGVGQGGHLSGGGLLASARLRPAGSPATCCLLLVHPMAGSQRMFVVCVQPKCHHAALCLVAGDSS